MGLSVLKNISAPITGCSNRKNVVGESIKSRKKQNEYKLMQRNLSDLWILDFIMSHHVGLLRKRTQKYYFKEGLGNQKNNNNLFS